MDKLFGKTVGMLSSMLDYHAKRHELIASNIVNIDTPHYKPKDLIFRKELEGLMGNKNGATMARTDKGHLPGDAIQVDQYNIEMVTSGEKVDIDQEMSNLAENNLRYNLAVELLARKFRNLNTVLREAK